MIPKEIAEVAERLARLDERMEGNSKISAAQAANTACRLNQIDARLEKTTAERDQRFDQLDARLDSIEKLLYEGKGMGKVMSFIWPPIGGFIAAAIATYMGFK